MVRRAFFFLLPITSGAVYKAFADWQRILNIDTLSFVDGVDTPLGKIIHISLQGFLTGNVSNAALLFTLPNDWRPVNQTITRFRVGVDTNSVRMEAGCNIHTDGTVNIFFGTNTPLQSSVSNVTGLYGDAYIILN